MLPGAIHLRDGFPPLSFSIQYSPGLREDTANFICFWGLSFDTKTIEYHRKIGSHEDTFWRYTWDNETQTGTNTAILSSASSKFEVAELLEPLYNHGLQIRPEDEDEGVYWCTIYMRGRIMPSNREQLEVLSGSPSSLKPISQYA